MQITVDHHRYTSLEELKALGENPQKKTLFEFLLEWFDDRPYVVGHTSGSTGTPKEIRLLKKDMEASARITNDFFKLGPSSRLLLCLSTSYIAGKMMVVRALQCGAELITRPVSSTPLTGLNETIDLAALVPLQVGESLKAPTATADFGHIRQMIIGGAPVDTPLQEKLKTIPTTCYSTYGMTETVSHIALMQLNGDSPTTCFQALGDVRFEQDDRRCLTIHAPHLQQQTFITNDLVRLVDRRRFEWLGRYDNVINSGGIKLSPETIEKKLASMLDVPFFITARTDDRLGQHVVLVVESPSWTPEEKTAFLERLRSRLPRFERPREIVCLEKFDRTESNKIIRKR